MQLIRHTQLMVSLAALSCGLVGTAARADEVLKLGVSLPLSGSGANWGRGNEVMCKRAAQEIKDAGGIKVKGTTYNIECVAYDNKYTSAEGTKVAQTLINRDGVKYMYVFGTPPLLAAQSITERQGVLLFNGTWALQSKGPKFPLSFSVTASQLEMMPAMFSYVASAHPQAKTVVVLNVNDPSGRDAEKVQRDVWEKNGVKLLTSDYFERGTTEFQPIAVRLFSQKPDIVDLGTTPLADAGMVLKELDVLGFKGIKVMTNGNSAEGLMATAGAAGNGVYMGGAVPFDGPSATAHQKKVNEEVRAVIGESLGFANIAGYDVVYMLKSALEKAQSLEPKDLATAMPSTKFRTFYGGETGWGRKDIYGSVQQALVPIYITQVVNGKLVEKARVIPKD